MLIQPTVDVGRSPEWQDRQLVGVALPARWNLPPVHEVKDPLTWHVVHSPVAVEWSNRTPAGSAAFPEVKRVEGREFAWQSRHEAGCALIEAWSFSAVTQPVVDR